MPLEPQGRGLEDTVFWLVLLVESRPRVGATYRERYLWVFEMRTYVFGMAMALGMAGVGARAQDNRDHAADAVRIVRGTVLNSVTKVPLARALVLADVYATFTDEQGRFEFQIREPQPSGGGQMSIGLGFISRKPGYLKSHQPAYVMVSPNSAKNEPEDVTIYLVPEARIVGYVEVSGSEGDVRIECELYRHNVSEGIEKWFPSGQFSTWANAEFRFSNLEAGTYKLITHEQMDRDSTSPVPGRPLFGYPPMYYPNTTDFSAAAPIVVKAGETAEVNLTVARRAYYPVRIGVINAPSGGPIEMTVYPMGHHSPGWSLGYNPIEQVVEGMLPDGNYTAELHSFGRNGAAGTLNFAVRGRPLVEGAMVTMVPLAPIAVNVHEEFRANQSSPGSIIHGGAGLQVRLIPLEELPNSGDRYIGPVQNFDDRYAEPVQGSEDHALVLNGVPPGHYKIRVISGEGYAASIDYGGVDLLKQPLVVGPGGGSTPIEITLRNDGAEIDGTLQEENPSEPDALRDNGGPPRHIYLIPLGDPMGDSKEENTSNNFQFTQVPPGDYLVLAFEEEQPELPSNNSEKLQALESKGQVLHLEAGQKASVNVKVIAEGDSQ